MKRMTEWLLITIFFLTSLAPLFGALTGLNSRVFASQQTTQMPQLVSDGAINVAWTLDFDEHWGRSFPFHSFLSSRYHGLIRTGLRSSPIEKVIIGRDGFFYFGDTIDDILYHQSLSEGDLKRILTVLKLQSRFAREKGAEYLFFVAPNKASIYPEYLPGYLLPVGEKSNLDVFRELSSQAPVYDALQVLREEKAHSSVLLYHKEDSHWNNLGAYMAYVGLMEKLELEPLSWGDDLQVRNDFQGDLTTMYYPDTERFDAQWYDESYMRRFVELRPMRTLEDLRIETRNSSREGRLLMYRDSFANALIPFLSDSFEQALYLRSSTLDLREVERFDADIVVFEIVERNLDWILQRTPIMPAPKTDWEEGLPVVNFPARIELSQQFNMTYLNAKWLEEADDVERVRVLVGEQAFEAFPIAQDEDVEDGRFDRGFSMYIEESVESLRIQFLRAGRWYELDL